jgi:hypothetical protein
VSLHRFNAQEPCAVCRGYPTLARGKGERCYGFLSDDAEWAHCTREDHAGGLPEHPNSGTYAHKMTGDCNCGTRHDARPSTATPTTSPKATNKGKAGKAKPSGQIVKTYDYRDRDGALQFQTVRKDPKDFYQRRPDGQGGWINNLDGVERLPYRLPELAAAAAGSTVFDVEGEKDADRLTQQGFIATTNPLGAGKWTPELNKHLRGFHVVLLPDNDDTGRQHATAVAYNLFRDAASIKVVELPGLPEKGDVSDWLDAGHTADELRALVEAAPEWQPARVLDGVPAIKLPEVRTIFQKWLYMPDVGPLYAMLGAIAANYTAGDPVWLLLVGPPGFGKSELINAAVHLQELHAVSVLTEAALLSGTAKRDRTQQSSGGVLRKMGQFGILSFKDFTSLLSMQKDQRATVLAALREIYDGSWTRHVGVDGGQTLHWSGKAGLIGGSTPAIDAHHAVMAALGERFALLRVPEGDEEARADKALDHAGHEIEMREELSGAVRGLFAGLTFPRHRPTLTEPETRFLISLASLVVRCRSAVDRDPQNKEITLIPGAEAPTRLIVMLSNLFGGLLTIGLQRDEAWQIVRRIGLDSMPALRRRCLETLAAATDALSTSSVATAIDHPTSTVHRSLEELAAYAVASRTPQGAGRADLWALTKWARDKWAAVDTSSLIPVDMQGKDTTTTTTTTTPTGIKDEVRAPETQAPLPNGNHPPPTSRPPIAPLFPVTHEWQDVPEGAILPNGIEFHTDFQTGRRQVRWDPRAYNVTHPPDPADPLAFKEY